MLRDERNIFQIKLLRYPNTKPEISLKLLHKIVSFDITYITHMFIGS